MTRILVVVLILPLVLNSCTGNPYRYYDGPLLSAEAAAFVEVSKVVNIVSVEPQHDIAGFRKLGNPFPGLWDDSQVTLLPGRYRITARLLRGALAYRKSKPPNEQEASPGFAAIAIIGLIVLSQGQGLEGLGRSSKETFICDGLSVTADLAAGRRYIIDGDFEDGSCRLWVKNA